ncbi:MAG: hypothetical protein AAGF99_17965 [Bacteroidota bacterium]
MLIALVGGLGASWAHEVHHAIEWAEVEALHADDHRVDGDHVTTPCDDCDSHELDCTACSAFGSAVTGTAAPADPAGGSGHQVAVHASVVSQSWAITPARGPPAIA